LDGYGPRFHRDFFAGAEDILTVAVYVPSIALFYFFENIALRKYTTV